MKEKVTRWRARTKTDLIIEVWEALGWESIGAAELERIQDGIQQAFGAGAVDSPASIARRLADEGAVLRHPEVLDFDSEWRQRFGLAEYREMSFATLVEATRAIQQLEIMRREHLERGDDLELLRQREYVSEVRDDLRLTAKSQLATELRRAEAKEIAEWIAIWQSTPDLFADWLELRFMSAEFQKLFPDFRR